MRPAQEHWCRGAGGKRAGSHDVAQPASYCEWLEWAEQAGLGELRLLPEQFWALTPREFLLMWAGFERAEQRAEWLVGRLALLTTHYEKPYGSPERLLGYRLGMNRYPVKAWLNRPRRVDEADT